MNARIFFTSLLLVPAIAMAGVNTKNGNFYITYQDFVQESNGHELDITRTYNSKASGAGWFGFGWASTYETRLIVMPDGAVVVQENGSGRDNYYAPKDGSRLPAGVGVIVAVAVERDKLDPEAANVLRQKLLADAELRQKEVLKYGIKTELSEGGSAQSNNCSFVTRIKNEYRRTKCEERNWYGKGTDYFDLEGHLIRNEDGDYKLTVHYAGKYPDRIEDSLGQKIFLMWNSEGHVKTAWPVKGKPIETYSYDESGNLLLANQIDGNYYRYQYDANHNLTRIGYIDNTHMDMQYNEKSLITSVTDPDGSKVTYSYREDANNPTKHYWTTITSISETGEKSSREDEFLLGTNEAGVEHIAGISRTEGQKKKSAVMDEQGRIKSVQNPDGSSSEYFYHPTLGKLSSIVTGNESVVFAYDDAGNLIRVYNTQDQLIELSYDGKKHITRIVETNKTEHTRRELTFKYNALGKPIKIKMAGKGEINVVYDEQGELTKVESKQGSKIALEVSKAIQILLKMVKPAGVDLGI